MTLLNWLRPRPTTNAQRPAHRPRLAVLPLEDRAVPSTFQGVVFDDTDADGVRGGTEAGLAGWTVFLDVNRNAVPDPGEATRTTDATGRYFFDTTDAPPAVVATDGSGRVADYVGLVLDNATAGLDIAAGRWLNTNATFGRAIRQSEPDAVYDFGVRFQPYDGAAPAGPEGLVNAATAGPQVGATGGNASPGVSVAADPAGNYVVAWTTEVAGGPNTVYARAFAADGTPRTGDVPVATGAGYRAVEVAVAGNGRFVVAWQGYTPLNGASMGSVYARPYLADGSAAGPAITVVAAASTRSGVLHGVAADAAGNAVVLYTTAIRSSRGIWGEQTISAQRYTPAGAASGKAVAVAKPSLHWGGAGVAMDGAGNFVAVWEEAGVQAQRYDAAGRAVGGRLAVGAGAAQNVTVAMNPAGRFAVAYSVAYNQTSYSERYARVFSPDGTPAGGAVRFAAGNRAAAGLAGVAVDAAGDVTLAWPDDRQPTDDTTHPYQAGEVRVRRLTAAGGLTAETIANATTQGRQSNPGVAATGAGTFVVAWQGSGPGDDQGVFARRFAPPAAPPAVSASAGSVAEGADGRVALTFTVTLSGAYFQPVTLNYRTADGTAAAGADYEFAEGTVVFAPGETTKTVTVWVLGDAAAEPDETVSLYLFDAGLNPVGTATGAIANDD